MSFCQNSPKGWGKPDFFARLHTAKQTAPTNPISGTISLPVKPEFAVSSAV
jgi:hypothetical protein